MLVDHQDEAEVTARGFTILELLIVLGLTLAIAGALATLVQPARAAFDRVPAELDQQQRGRTAIDVLSQALRSASRNISASDPASGGNLFGSLTVAVPIAAGAQGALAVDQPGNAGAITLATTPCPNVKDVCGFVAGAVALITDAQDHHDVFTIASTLAGARSLTPNHPLSQFYPAGSRIAEVEQYTFSLALQPDGSLTLIRETAAGAIQPVIDFVSDLGFTVSGSEVGIVVRVQASTESLRRVVVDRVFRTSIRLRNAS